MMCVEDSTGSRKRGYAVARLYTGGGKGWSLQAHRVAFEQAWGIRLKPGQVVRHACDNPPCVNPLHLQVGTQADNNRDKALRGHRGRWTHCKRGHLLDEHAYTYGNGKRVCGTCMRARETVKRRIDA